MRAIVVGVLPFVVAAGLVPSCGGSGNNPGPEGGADGMTSRKDGGSRDGHAGDSRPSDAKGSNGTALDVMAGDGPSGDAAAECHQLTGGGSTLSCTSTSVPSICAESGHEPGPCPSADLTGCCIFSSGNTICFYSSDSVPASQEEATCKSGSGSWVTSAP
jgi:hypothetical protein